MPKQMPDNPHLILDEVLEPGDLLFVPGSYWHHCESGQSTSVHPAVAFLPQPAGTRSTKTSAADLGRIVQNTAELA